MQRRRPVPITAGRAAGALLLAACMTVPAGAGRAAEHAPATPGADLQAEHYALAVSAASDRTDARPLHGATLSQEVYVFVTPQHPLAPPSTCDSRGAKRQ